MDNQRLLFENLKKIKDVWVDSSVEALNKEADLIWSDCESEYKILQNKIHTEEEKSAYRKVMNELIKGCIHSILVMIDGGDSLADYYKLDLIDRNSGKSLKSDTLLNEEFFSFLFDVEEV